MQNLKEALEAIFAHDAPFISERDAHYESSWKSRGGPGAFFTVARPWDRFAAIAKRNRWDIFKVIQAEIDAGKTENDDGTLQACIRDLRAYMALLAVEAARMRTVYGRAYEAAQPAGTHTSPPKEQPPTGWREKLTKLKARRDARQGACTAIGVDADLEMLMELLFSI